MTCVVLRGEKVLAYLTIGLRWVPCLIIYFPWLRLLKLCDNVVKCFVF